ncbi:SRPBCC domain-containing protein [Streptomyces sp. NPDC052682]|uniref:SRPBCC domain-containing protein n=1 Tax=Streptomyces sp. NPDC052682 TaxID=3154954 RepID=UPI003441914F
MEHEVFVPVAAERLRAVLDDPARVARAVPGLQQDAGAEPVAGRLKVRIGSHSITYRGSVRLSRQDERTYAVEGDAAEARGTGSVTLALRLRLRDAEGGTALVFEGAADADGRVKEFPAEAVEAAAGRLLNRFAEQLAEAADSGASPEPDADDYLAAGDFEPRATDDFETTPDADDSPPPATGAQGDDETAADAERADAGGDEDDSGVSAADAGVGEGNSGVGAADAGVDEAGAGVSAAGAGVGEGDSGVGAADAGVGEGDSGVGAADAGVDEGVSGVSAAGEGVEEGDAGLDAADAGVDEVDAGAERADAGDSGVGAAGAGVSAADAGVGDADTGVDQADAGVDAADAGLDAADAGLDEGDAEASETDAGVGETGTGVEDGEEGDDTRGDEPVAEAAHARRTMIGRSAEEVDHAPPRGRYAPVPAPQTIAPPTPLRWAGPAAALALASAIVAVRALRRRR